MHLSAHFCANGLNVKIPLYTFAQRDSHEMKAIHAPLHKRPIFLFIYTGVGVIRWVWKILRSEAVESNCLVTFDAGSRGGCIRDIILDLLCFASCRNSVKHAALHQRLTFFGLHAALLAVVCNCWKSQHLRCILQPCCICLFLLFAWPLYLHIGNTKIGVLLGCEFLLQHLLSDHFTCWPPTASLDIAHQTSRAERCGSEFSTNQMHSRWHVWGCQHAAIDHWTNWKIRKHGCSLHGDRSDRCRHNKCVDSDAREKRRWCDLSLLSHQKSTKMDPPSNSPGGLVEGHL